MSAEEFEALYRAEIDKLNAGNEKRIEKAFVPFVPFSLRGLDSLPAFPIEELPPALENYVREVAENKQVAEDMAAVAALAMVSLAVQGKVLVNPKPGWIEPVNLYEVVVALPSDRKSPVLNAISEPVYEYIQAENERRDPIIREYQSKINVLEKRKFYLSDQLSKQKKGAVEVSHQDLYAVEEELEELKKNAVRPLRIMADDVTPEALTGLLADNGGKMAVVSSEGGIFDIIAGRYSDKANMDIFLKAYTGDPVMVDRKAGPGVQIKHPAITILLMTQPKVLTAIMENGEFRGRGFLARFLYSIPQSRVGTRRYETADISDQAKLAYRVLLKTLIEIPETDKPMIIRFSPEAHEISKAFFESLEPRLRGDLEDIEDWAGKFHGQIMRIAALLHCCQYIGDADKVPLSADTILRAQRIGEYFLEHAKAAFHLMGMSEPQEEKDAKYILKRLDTIDGDSTSKRDLLRLCDGHLKTADDLQAGLDLLVDRGYLYIEKVSTGGRPTEKIYINPEYQKKKGTKGTEPLKD